MMINKKLIKMVGEGKKYIFYNVLCQWLSLIANIVMMLVVARFLESLYQGSLTMKKTFITILIAISGVAIRFVCTLLASRLAYLSSRRVKKRLREMIYEKLLRLGTSYRDMANTSEVVQVAVEGVEQLESYFASYLPQFFYAMLAPITLFIVLSFVSVPSAILLLVCVPMIPVTIILIQKWAKKLLSKYWGQYVALSDTFLENLQGMTTLKIYQADEFKHIEMNKQSEHFRKITMKVLTMQLNSITIMDLIAYGGTALGVILATTRLSNGEVSIFGCILIILLAADFFLPMRLLGSFFHIAMNGMAAADKIFNMLDIEETVPKTAIIGEDCSICFRKLHFSYDSSREILHGIDMEFPMGSFTAIVGKSGCGKSTVSSLIMGRNKNYFGEITVGGIPLSEINEESLMKNITYISHKSYLFKGTVRDNLLMALPSADEHILWEVLERVKMSDFLKSEQGLDTRLKERASNLSGGQRQRLALARAILHDSPVYIFDEATSNIDVESENDIMDEIIKLSRQKTVILISHRLANVVAADKIYVLESGNIVESGTHRELLALENVYAGLWKSQQKLENYAMGGMADEEKWV